MEIKLDKIKDERNQKEITKEYNILQEVKKLNIKTTSEIENIFREIKKVNIDLWLIEDKIRIFEKKLFFSEKILNRKHSGIEKSKNMF